MPKKTYLDILTSNDLLSKSPVQIKGTLYPFILHWIRGGCRDLTGINYLEASGMREQDWNRHKNLFMTLLDELTRDISVIYHKEDKRKVKQRLLAERARQVLKRVRLKEKIESNKDKQLNDSEFSHEYRSGPYKDSDSLPITPAYMLKTPKKNDKSWFTDKKIKE